MINSILINLPRRTDRLEHAKKEIAKFDLDLSIMNAMDMPDNTTLAIRESHKKCIKYASDFNLSNVLVIEDDICFRENSKPYFDELTNNLPSDYEVCLFGIYSGAITETTDKYWNKINKFSGAHFYLVNQTAYNKILDYNGTHPIDHWIGQNLNCYISKKHFAYQLDGYSDNSKCITDYNNVNLKKYEQYFLV